MTHQRQWIWGGGKLPVDLDYLDAKADEAAAERKAKEEADREASLAALFKQADALGLVVVSKDDADALDRAKKEEDEVRPMRKSRSEFTPLPPKDGLK